MDTTWLDMRSDGDVISDELRAKAGVERENGDEDEDEDGHGDRDDAFVDVGKEGLGAVGCSYDGSEVEGDFHSYLKR
jgi:hypothetical protein